MKPSFLSRSPLAFLVLAALLASVLAGCDDGTRNAGQGTVALYLTDAPTLDFDNVFVTITRVEAVGGGPTVTLSDRADTFDLLALRDRAVPLLTAEGVPARDYAMLRLHVSSVSLVPFGGGDPIPARVPGGMIDVIASGPFRLGDGKVLTALLDIDADLSIHVVETTPGVYDYLFRPVVFVNLGNPATWGRRVVNYCPVRNVDPLAGRFEQYTSSTLASPAVLPGYAATEPPGFPGYDRTLMVLASDAAVFDNTGLPAGLASIGEYEWVTVTATPRVVADGEDFDGDGDRTDEILVLDAELVERIPVPGWVKSRTGVVSQVHVDGSFTLSKTGSLPLHGVPDPVVAAPVAGSRIFGWWGGEKGWGDLAPGDLVTVKGYWDNDAQRFRSTACYWFTAQGNGAEANGLEGVIVSLDPGDTSLVMAPTARSGRTGYVPVRLLPPCGISLTTAYVVGYTAAVGIDFTDLQPGQTVRVYGWEAADGCLYAWSVSGWPSDTGIPLSPW